MAETLTHRFGLRIPTELWDRIVIMAKKHRRSVNDEIVSAVEYWLDDMEAIEQAEKSPARPIEELWDELDRELLEKAKALSQGTLTFDDFAAWYAGRNHERDG